MPHTRLIIAIICLLLSASGFASDDETIYKWVDTKDQVHFGNNPPIGSNATLVVQKNPPSEKDVSEAQAINASLTQSIVASASLENKRKNEICEKAKQEYAQVNAATVPANEADQHKAILEEKRIASEQACSL